MSNDKKEKRKPFVKPVTGDVDATPHRMTTKMVDRKTNPDWWHEKARLGELSENQINVLTQRQIARKNLEREKKRERIPAPNGPFDPNTVQNSKKGLIIGRRMRKT